MSIVAEFLTTVQKIHATGIATEHSYRSAFETLFSSLSDGISALNEPKRVKVGAPDFVIQQGDIVIGHVEAKDLHIGLRGMKDANKNQQDRYRKALSNLIYTNCLDWDFYRDGELYASVTVADFVMGIQPIPEKFEELENLLRDYIAQRPQSITSPKNLAERMAGKAVLIKDVLQNALREDENLQTELANQYRAFKEHLIHDITATDFADIYAETIAYGMFAARLHDKTLDTFDRQEALELLPKSNPFLRSLFGYIAGHDLDDRIKWIIDDLARVFRAADVAKIMKGFGKLTGQNDPFLHFYETFLAAYNPAKRKARGVWYTPEPVVNFIVRAVDEVLQTEFGLPDGLADTSKVTIDWDTGQTHKGKPVTIKKEVHRVQILDPATGTGTFLAEVIKQIAPKVKDGAEGMWSPYIERDLIPRLHGFELLMASYAMCHMKLDMMLTELGYKPTGTPPRLGVYLTNSLEEGEPANQSLPFAQWLSNEVKEANTIKRDMPIMCVVGNPPYSGISQNNGDWIASLIEDYKYVDGVHFGERKHWLQDDYVKFIRLSEHLIEKNGDGVLAFITNHGYLDNPTFRAMRWHLMQTFDEISVFDLHGNANKKETTPDGKPDRNVFDIRQGVAIVICLKKSNKADCVVRHKSIYGTRATKYAELEDNQSYLAKSEIIEAAPPYFMFYPINSKVLKKYDQGFQITDIMRVNQKGIISARDHLATAFNKDELDQRLTLFCKAEKTDDEIRSYFWPGKKKKKYLPGDTRGWKINEVRPKLREEGFTQSFRKIQYRPFDERIIAYTIRLVDWPRTDFMSNFTQGQNIGIMFNRGVEEQRPFSDVFVFDKITQHHSLSLKEANNIAPLYLYPDEQDLDQTRRVNFDPKLWKQLQAKAAHPTHGEPDELQTFDFIYGVLHCPAYRDTYAEFLKIDFPRIPWPATPDEFWDISAKGAQLRQLHLMDPATIGPAPYPFKGEGDATVDKPRFEDGKVWINATQYFDAAPPISWGFYIGGYQPAQKWLKDRKGRELSFDDVKHYQRILKILSETDRIMKTINMTLKDTEKQE